MAIDASIYNNIKQYEAPSMMESQARAANLSQVAMQNQKMANQMQAEQKQKQLLAMGGAIESVTSQPKENWEAEYNKQGEALVKAGLIDQIPPYSEQTIGMLSYQLSNNPEYLQLKKARAEIAALNAKAKSDPIDLELDRNIKRSQAAQNWAAAGKARNENGIPLENKEQINKLAGSNAGKVAIVKAIDSTVEMLDDPKLSDDQKLMQARQMIKTLNSTQGQDAVGAEEAKRLAGFLEFRIGNFTEPGPMFGRAPISEFSTQAKLTARGLKSSINQNQGVIDELKTGRKLSVEVPTVESIVQSPKMASPGLMTEANAAEMPKPPKHGTVEDGYVFMGGDPSNQKNWKRAK